jgi:4-amino-4-deoxy-L-arabinose transferase-like glycosyltransferase
MQDMSNKILAIGIVTGVVTQGREVEVKGMPEFAAVDRPNVVAPATRRYWALAGFALGVLIWFGNINYRTLTEPDEGRYAEIPREMLASGDWVTPHLNGLLYLEKPPLQYWATALAYSALGEEPWVSRLWGTTLGMLGIVVTYLLGRTLWDRRTGLLAALILASCPLYFVVGHLNTLDIGLAFFLNAALACFIIGLRTPVDSTAQRHWMWLCWCLLGLGFLQKGLVALALPGLALGIYSLVYRDKSFWRRLHVGAGVLIVTVLAAPWLIMVSARNPDFLHFFFLHEHLERFTSTVHGRVEPWWYFIAILLVGVIPWVVPIARATFERLRSSDDVLGERLLLVWAVTVVVFFSLSGSKLAPYIAPALMPLALMSGRWLTTRHSSTPTFVVAISMFVFCLLLASSRWLVPQLVEPGIKRTAYLQMSEWAEAAAVINAIGIAAYMILLRTSLYRATAALAIAFATALAVLLCASNSIELVRGRKGLDTFLAPYLKSDTPFYCVGMYWQALVFSLQRTCTPVAYEGELGTRFDPQQRQWIQLYEDFVPRWNRQLNAVAVVNPHAWEHLQHHGVHARVVLRDSNVIVMIKP